MLKLRALLLLVIIGLITICLLLFLEYKSILPCDPSLTSDTDIYLQERCLAQLPPGPFENNWLMPGLTLVFTIIFFATFPSIRVLSYIAGESILQGYWLFILLAGIFCILKSFGIPCLNMPGDNKPASMGYIISEVIGGGALLTAMPFLFGFYVNKFIIIFPVISNLMTLINGLNLKLNYLYRRGVALIFGLLAIGVGAILYESGLTLYAGYSIWFSGIVLVNVGIILRPAKKERVKKLRLNRKKLDLAP